MIYFIQIQLKSVIIKFKGPLKVNYSYILNDDIIRILESRKYFKYEIINTFPNSL